MRRSVQVLAVGSLFLAGAIPARALSAAPPRTFDGAFQQELNRLAAKCDELGLADQALITRGWFIERGPGRQYLFFPPPQDRHEPPEAAPQVVKFWYQSFTKARRQQAAQLYDLALKKAEDNPTECYQLLHETLHENPNHAEARRVLGYRPTSRGWTRAQSVRPRAGRKTHPMFGWTRGKYWEVDTEHFEIFSSHSADAGVELAKQLEETYAVWQQLFFPYWSVEGRLAQRIAGGKNPIGSHRRFQVVLFRDRQEYLEQLSKAEPRIGMSVGFYSDRHEMSLFYAGDDAKHSTRFHEVTHQFFQESARVEGTVGDRADFWIVEGVALYMESMQRHNGFYTVGGFDADRLQFARYRQRNEQFYLPLAELSRLGRAELQLHKDIRRLYSQSAGLAHFLMDGAEGRYRAALARYLDGVYHGRSRAGLLAECTGTDTEQLDAQYADFLNVKNEQLRFAHPATRNLCLGHTEVDDTGMVALGKLDQLDWLDLTATGVTDDGVEHVQSRKTLRQLSLERTRITDTTLEKLAGYGQLEELDLSGAPISDEGLAHVGRLTGLKVLWLTGTDVSDTGLAQLANLKNLELLDVQATRVTPAGLQRLRQQLPKLKDGPRP